MPNATVAASKASSANGRSRASATRKSTPRAAPRRLRRAPGPSIRSAKSTPTTSPEGGHPVGQREGQVAGAGADVERPVARGQVGGGRRRPAPAAVEAGGHRAVEQVVARGDAVEHRPHLGRGQACRTRSRAALPRGPRPRPSARCRSCSTPRWSSALATMKSTRSSTVRGQVVEARHRRHHHRARPRDGGHVLDVDQAERRLAGHQHQPAALLQHHVGAAVDEVARRAVRDRTPRVEPEQGAISAAGASDEPEANGAVRSLSPSTRHRPAAGGEALDEGRHDQGRVVGRPRPGLEDLVADDVGAGVAHAEARRRTRRR